MPRDEQRPASRLSPPRPDYEWVAESRSAPPPRGHSPSRRLVDWEDDAGEFEPSSTRYDEEVIEADFSFSEEADQPLVFRRPKVGARHNGGAYDASYVEPPVREDRVDTASRLTPPPAVNKPAVFKETVLPEETQDLSVQERHQLLIHMIELYDDLWKLAGIRANEKKDRLEAYLIPRSQRVELKEAISKNIALIITIDSRGNTDIREPKSKSAWRKFTTWLFGS